MSKGFSHDSKEKSDRFSFLIRSYFLFHFTNELQGNQQIAFERCEFFVGIMVNEILAFLLRCFVNIHAKDSSN